MREKNKQEKDVNNLAILHDISYILVIQYFNSQVSET